jgi:hypothetical protein
MTRPHPAPAVLAAAVAALLALASPAAAQDPVPPTDTIPVPRQPLPDPQPLPEGVPVTAPHEAPAITERPGVPMDTVQTGISPRSAFLRSLVVPGWGQSSLGVPGRGSVYFALEAGSLWMVYKSNRKLQEARRAEQVMRETGEIEPTARSPLARDRRAQREDWITLSVFWLFVSGADAFVAAHLMDFEERIEVRPTPEGGVELRASVPVGQRR